MVLEIQRGAPCWEVYSCFCCIAAYILLPLQLFGFTVLLSKFLRFIYNSVPHVFLTICDGGGLYKGWDIPEMSRLNLILILC